MFGSYEIVIEGGKPEPYTSPVDALERCRELKEAGMEIDREFSLFARLRPGRVTLSFRGDTWEMQKR